MRFTESFIQQVRDSSEIVKTIGDYVRLKRKGRSYLGLCPFHNEKTPSFNVNPETGLYHCFGCGVGGNVFTFIMEIENLSFAEAVQFLAERAGIPVEHEEISPEQQAKLQTQRRLAEIADLTGKYYAYLLENASEAAKARQYVLTRGITDEAVTAFNLGFAKAEWSDLLSFLKKRGYSEVEALSAGLVLPRQGGSGYYDRFRDRLIFPIRNHQGMIIAFGGRIVDEKSAGPKYLNSPETDLFTKGAHLYGLDQAKAVLRKGEPAIITEGYMDVISLHSAGFRSAVASMGTALTEEQARLLSRFTSKALIAYDGDSAGTTATWRGLEILSKYGLEVKVIVLPVGQDPDSLVRSHGPKAFREAIQRALPLIDYKLEKSISSFDLDKLDERVKAARAVLPVLAELNGAVAREAYLDLAAKKIGVSVTALRRELDSYEIRLRKGTNVKRNIFPDNRNNIIASGNKETPALGDDAHPVSEIAMVTLLLKNPKLLAEQFSEEDLKYFTDPALREILRAIFETAGSAETVDPAAMVDRLDGHGVKKLLTELIFAKELPGLVEKPHDCMVRVRIHYFQEELKDLTQNLINIRNNGQVAEINQMTLDYINLYQEAQQILGERGGR